MPLLNRLFGPGHASAPVLLPKPAHENHELAVFPFIGV